MQCWLLRSSSLTPSEPELGLFRGIGTTFLAYVVVMVRVPVSISYYGVPSESASAIDWRLNDLSFGKLKQQSLHSHYRVTGREAAALTTFDTGRTT